MKTAWMEIDCPVCGHDFDTDLDATACPGCGLILHAATLAKARRYDAEGNYFVLTSVTQMP